MMAKQHLSLVLTVSAVATAIACGTPPPPANQPSGDIIPLTTPSATGPTPAPKATTSSAPEASAPAASASAAKPPRPVSAGAPMVVSEGEKEVTSAYSVSGGIIRIGGAAELSIPREALPEMYGFTFALNTGKTMLKITPYKGQLGDIYRLFIFKEDASTQAINLASGGGPFVLKLPIKGAKTANLVVGTADNGKAKYTIVAPKSVLTADTGNTGVFELNNLPGEAILHLTSAPPTP